VQRSKRCGSRRVDLRSGPWSKSFKVRGLFCGALAQFNALELESCTRIRELHSNKRAALYSRCTAPAMVCFACISNTCKHGSSACCRHPIGPIPAASAAAAAADRRAASLLSHQTSSLHIPTHIIVTQHNYSHKPRTSKPFTNQTNHYRELSLTSRRPLIPNPVYLDYTWNAKSKSSVEVQEVDRKRR